MWVYSPKPPSRSTLGSQWKPLRPNTRTYYREMIQIKSPNIRSTQVRGQEGSRSLASNVCPWGRTCCSHSACGSVCRVLPAKEKGLSLSIQMTGAPRNRDRWMTGNPKSLSWIILAAFLACLALLSAIPGAAPRTRKLRQSSWHDMLPPRGQCQGKALFGQRQTLLHIHVGSAFTIPSNHTGQTTLERFLGDQFSSTPPSLACFHNSCP